MAKGIKGQKKIKTEKQSDISITTEKIKNK